MQRLRVLVNGGYTVAQFTVDLEPFVKFGIVPKLPYKLFATARADIHQHIPCALKARLDLDQR